MCDLIDRQAAIDACFDGWNNSADDCARNIKSLPAADVVPVVRCKECKFRENDDFCTGRGFPYQLVPADGFCDKGERKE